ncbi:hypothetical protein LMG28138_05778 [Pararobbsia alpina]|uniref:Uncharacterized protein n=1 Tax=Pararobbsia alpina TaxID=621374 RepID=A0A6S7BML5_9BURK|nr:hypothetical protein LMG28138_05778 [Pararobbsia alpina]
MGGGIGAECEAMLRGCRIELIADDAGLDDRGRRSRSIETMEFRCIEWSSTTAVLTDWPHMEVPAPRGRTAAWASLADRTAPTSSSIVRGGTTQSGTCR